ncbi:hypothetical protein AURDEDRAFT_116265 [Auricularia subglabra TFB-10046 SS5]|uniref:MYND-type domain-containing protein n=1 Tax=Auricularia subglabra (strain TFB-10046 / SS5) TaxID=717982 RepID=J0WX17_AURST|nr:hypothetical protein AURDEDRAFT_116265 [Auricularia subglabra TFB-10046 SS5]
MLKTLAAECEDKLRKRLPLKPRPQPVVPGPADREKAKELRCHALGLLKMLYSEAGDALSREEQIRSYRHVLELCNESLAADATISYAITHRATAHFELDMWEESAADAEWAEQLVRESTEPSNIVSLVNALFHAGQAKLKLGRFEESLSDLQLAQELDPADDRVPDELEAVRHHIAAYKARSAGDARKERSLRIDDYSGFGLSLYELALLDEAGLCPWTGYAKHILRIVNSAEKDIPAPATKSRSYHKLTQCHSCFVNKLQANLFLCAQCKAAMYCSKECQQKAWKDHKILCTESAARLEELKLKILKPAPNCEVPDQPTTALELSEYMSSWTTKHRPLLAKTLVGALRLHMYPAGHLTKGLRITVEWVSGAQATARRFRMVDAALLDFDSEAFPEGPSSELARRNMEDAQKASLDGDCVAMITIVCVSCWPKQSFYAPVIVERGGEVDLPEKFWIDSLSSVIG